LTKFTYDKASDSYTCPAGSILRTNGRWHNHNDANSGKEVYQFKRYVTPDCKCCSKRYKCTQSKQNGRAIDRSEYAEMIEANTKRVIENPDYYRKRQQIAEHMYGTLKRQRGFTHTNVRGKEKVLGEVGLMFIGYNLTRCISILGAINLIKALKECLLYIFFAKNWLILSIFELASFSARILTTKNILGLKSLKTGLSYSIA
jgi:hypothetical protein